MPPSPPSVHLLAGLTVIGWAWAIFTPLRKQPPYIGATATVVLLAGFLLYTVLMPGYSEP
jgi:hypothetical protein